MAKTVTIASRIPMAIRMEEAERNPDKPGLSKERRSIVIQGAGNELGTVEGLTRDVDEALFDAWVKANPNHAAVVNGLLRKVGADEEPEGIVYGFETALPAPDVVPAEALAAKEKQS
ncbi:hypothetical protein [Bosea sp. TAF32]|uniref:hypothetical protein n=1 Tax=Bosea sp. TAF32 TaxID=3237482 RepID=UPI003F9228BA